MKKETKKKVFDLYGSIFLLSQRLKYLTDKELKKDQLTTKQFLTIAAIEKLFDYPPSINEVAEVLSTSHQNIKQIANQLEKKGFILIERDEKDRRRLRLKVTEKNRRYWDFRAEESEKFVLSLFSSLDEDEIHRFHSLVTKLLADTDAIYKNARKRNFTRAGRRTPTPKNDQNGNFM